MKYLLDTHVWIWSLLEPSKLSPSTRELLIDPSHRLFLSPISIWETLILIEKKRLQVASTPGLWVKEALRSSPLRQAPLTQAIALRSRVIDLPHQDPADRFIAATALEYGWMLITADHLLLASTQISTVAAQ